MDELLADYADYDRQTLQQNTNEKKLERKTAILAIASFVLNLVGNYHRVALRSIISGMYCKPHPTISHEAKALWLMAGQGL